MNEGFKLEIEAQRATTLLKGKVISVVWRHRSSEVGMEFTDGTRLFVEHTQPHQFPLP